MNSAPPARSVPAGYCRSSAWTSRPSPSNLPAREHRQPGFLELNPAAKVPSAGRWRPRPDRIRRDRPLSGREVRRIVASYPPTRACVPTSTVGCCLRSRSSSSRCGASPATRRSIPKRIACPPTWPSRRRDFAPMAAVLEESLKGRTYVAGDRVTAADFVLAYTLDWAGEAQLLGDVPQAALLCRADVRAAARSAAHRGILPRAPRRQRRCGRQRLRTSHVETVRALLYRLGGRVRRGA